MAHILAIPYPLQGHINPMIQLCNRLSTQGVHITFVTTVSITPALKRNSHTTSNLINFETLPDSAIDHAVEGLNVYDTFVHSFRASITSGISDIIDRHCNSDTPLKAILYDSTNPWMLDIANGKGLNGAVLFTQPCSVCSVFYHLHKGSLEISPDDDDESEVSLPGIPVMRVKDLPSVVYDMRSHPSLLRLLVDQFLTFEKADWRLFNTFDKLEDEILEWMTNKYPIRAIGPTVPSMYMDKRMEGNYDYGFSLFEPKTESCTKWLDGKDECSVIYVSFGSLANLSKEQMEEVAWGLLDSKCNFLWVVRETEEKLLPQDFRSGLMEKGLIVNWCIQLEVLSHRAVGCFLSHCGWNSTIEALSLGVPMMAMPHWSDQTTTAKLIIDVWGTGVRVKAGDNGVVTREEVAARADQVLQPQGGDELRRNALKWKALALEAVSEGGSSDMNIAELATELINT